VASGRLKSEEPVSGTLRAELSEEEVARIASFGTASFVKSVNLEEGRFAVEAEVEVFGTRVPVKVEGELGLQEGELFFKPGQVEALGEPVPDRVVRGLLGGTEFVFPIGELPFEGEISGIELHEGVLVFTGQVKDLPVG
jgi:LmeA-like phospholipid-binding